MPKNILLFMGSPRKNGNTHLMCNAFVQGAKRAGHQAEIVFVPDSLQTCQGCGICKQNGGICVLKDDMQLYYPKIQKADVLVFGSPLYYFGLSAQIKKVMDRFNCLDNTIQHGKGTVLLMPATAGGFDPAIANFRAFANYLGMRVLSVITAGGFRTHGSVAGNSVLQKIETFAATL